MLQNLNFVDYIILGLLGVSIFLGFIHGFIRSILSVCVWIAAFFISAFYGPHLATTFSLVTNNPEWQLWLSYGTVFIAAIIIGFVVKLILNLILTGGNTGILNRFFGALFGSMRGALIVALFIWFAILAGMNQTPAFENSRLIPVFTDLVTLLESWFPQINQQAQTTLNSINPNPQIGNNTQSMNQALASQNAKSGSGFSDLVTFVKSWLSKIN
jgi:membrane protein required for colicin V production